MMNVYTMQLGKWRLAQAQGIEVINITLKTGMGCFAPSPNMLARYRAGIFDATQFRNVEEEYTHHYNHLMQRSYVLHAKEWEWLIDKILYDEGSLALTCYCPEGKFCHRYLFLEMLRKCIEQRGHFMEYLGEIK